MKIKVPPGFDPGFTTVLQMFPSAGLHSAARHAAYFDIGDDETCTLPVVGWASVMTMQEDGLPTVALEPVVEEECFGPIIASDLTRETGYVLRGVE